MGREEGMEKIITVNMNGVEYTVVLHWLLAMQLDLLSPQPTSEKELINNK